MKKHVITSDETVESVEAWFLKFGGSDTSYMRAHWQRYLKTREFVLSTVAEDEKLTILDMGAHWLHNAFLYANLGHRLICVDAPDLMTLPHINAVAEAMGADIRATRRMEKADGIADLPDNSVDIVLFCEIIEHLAFNPIMFWKRIYRILKPGGRIIVTTPNSFYYKTLQERLRRIIRGECFGLSIPEIFESGTYGHHWKEFTLAELQDYFTRLSPDFDTSRYQMIYHPEDENIELSGLMESIVAKNVDVKAFNIYMDIVLKSKDKGIEINPPWDPI